MSSLQERIAHLSANTQISYLDTGVPTKAPYDIYILVPGIGHDKRKEATKP